MSYVFVAHPMDRPELVPQTQRALHKQALAVSFLGKSRSHRPGHTCLTAVLETDPAGARVARDTLAAVSGESAWMEFQVDQEEHFLGEAHQGGVLDAMIRRPADHPDPRS